MNEDGPGCLAIPVLVVVVPLRLLWELIVAIARLLDAYLLRPIGWLYRNAVVRPVRWLLITLIGRPARWLLRALVLRPLGWFARTVLAPAARFVLRFVLRPVGRVLVAVGRAILRYALWPMGVALTWLVGCAGDWAGRVWRAVAPALRALGRVLCHAWYLAGIVLFHISVRPVRWIWRTGVRPALNVAHRAVAAVASRTVMVWRAVREPVRAAARSVYRTVGRATRGR